MYFAALQLVRNVDEDIEVLCYSARLLTYNPLLSKRKRKLGCYIKVMNYLTA